MDGPKGESCRSRMSLETRYHNIGEVCGGIITMHAVTALLQSTALSLSSGTCIAALLSEPNGTDGVDGDVAALRAAVHLSSCSPRAADGSFYDTSSSSLPRQGIQAY